MIYKQFNRIQRFLKNRLTEPGIEPEKLIKKIGTYSFPDHIASNKKKTKTLIQFISTPGFLFRKSDLFGVVPRDSFLRWNGYRANGCCGQI